MRKLILIFILAPLWLCTHLIVTVMVARHLGYLPVPVSLSGTGSMYPTVARGLTLTPQDQAQEIVATLSMYPYPGGLELSGRRFFLPRTIHRGDIVVVDSDRIEELTASLSARPAGLAKRVVALPGDTVEMRSGILYINSQPQLEPYVAAPRSTFGGSAIPDCQPFSLSPDTLFVLGDNRKASFDSRHELGPVALSEVKYVLPLPDQTLALTAHWRDTSKDLDPGSIVKFDQDLYLRLLNSRRSQGELPLLKSVSRLQLSAAKRGQAMFRSQDFSIPATISGYPMSRALADVGYSNIVLGESLPIGFFTAEELLENQFAVPASAKFLLEPDFQDIGIAAVAGEINHCPSQVIVQHFGGYIPPNYSADDIASWSSALTQLKSSLPSWEKLRTTPFYDSHSSDIDRLIQLFKQRIQGMESVVSKMGSNLWLTDADRQFVGLDPDLAREQSALVEKLNASFQ